MARSRRSRPAGPGRAKIIMIRQRESSEKRNRLIVISNVFDILYARFCFLATSDWMRKYTLYFNIIGIFWKIKMLQPRNLSVTRSENLACIRNFGLSSTLS